MREAKSENIMVSVQKLGKKVFTTHELIAISGKSASNVVQSLGRLEKQGLISKIYRGVWGEARARELSIFEIIPYLFPRQRVYVSFITALHLHGIIEQIPQVVTLASTVHTRTIKTKIGVFSVHQITPTFFDGFDWYKSKGNFLIAEPEKALVDSLYLSGRKKKQFGHFPEMHIPSTFSYKKAIQWAKRIREKKIRIYVLERLGAILKVNTKTAK